jgi:spermidine synthase
MFKQPSHIPQHQMCRLLVIALCFLLASCQAAVIVHEVRSDFSQIQVVDYGSRRALLFVGESGHQAVETLIDLNEPHRLQHPYARTMMAAGLIYRPDASTCLLVGLGGGAIVRFLNHHFPELSLDVVEIDPVVVRVSREYFGTVPGPRTRILIDDGFAYLQRTRDRYDLILMDVHLHPSEQTDRSGQPLHLKTAAFLRGLHERLRPGGVVLFNMIQGSDTAAYIDSIRAAFPAVEIFRPVGSGNVIVVGAPSGFLPSDAELRERARALDRREQYGFSFERLLDERRN